MSGFGRKGLAPGQAIPASRPGFGNKVDEHARLKAANQHASSALSDSDGMAAKRAAFIAAERQRQMDSEASHSVHQHGVSDYAEGYRSTRRTTSDRSLLLAYVLWFLVGQLSIHRFYLGATGSGWKQLGLFVGSLFMVFIFMPLGAIGLVVWMLWILADLFLMPGLHRKLCNGDPSPIFS